MIEHRFDRLVDIEQVRVLLQSHHDLSGMAYGVRDAEGKVLTAVGWQEICTLFHRVNPITFSRCFENDTRIREELNACNESYMEYRCGNGMIDLAIPIIIEQRHIATFLAGHFFYDDEKPDREYFRKQAGECGFDPVEYLRALDMAPVLGREFVRRNMLFLSNLVQFLAESGLKNLRLAIENGKRGRAEEEALRVKGEQLASMAIELSMAEERERRRIASELHDNVGQLLLLSKIKLDSLARVFTSSNDKKTYNELHDLIGRTIRDVRSLNQQLNPPLLASLGLEAALEWLAGKIRDDYSLHVNFSDDGNDKPLGEELASVLFQSARELLINTAKHAKTDEAWLTIGRQADRLRLVIVDRGAGFDYIPDPRSAISLNSTFGLFNISQRLNHLGGELVIESAPGCGTRATIHAPLLAGEPER